MFTFVYVLQWTTDLVCLGVQRYCLENSVMSGSGWDSYTVGAPPGEKGSLTTTTEVIHIQIEIRINWWVENEVISGRKRYYIQIKQEIEAKQVGGFEGKSRCIYIGIKVTLF